MEKTRINNYRISAIKDFSKICNTHAEHATELQKIHGIGLADKSGQTIFFLLASERVLESKNTLDNLQSNFNNGLESLTQSEVTDLEKKKEIELKKVRRDIKWIAEYQGIIDGYCSSNDEPVQETFEKSRWSDKAVISELKKLILGKNRTEKELTEQYEKGKSEGVSRRKAYEGMKNLMVK